MGNLFFGRNWRRFLRSINEERLAAARSSLAESLRMEGLRGKTFLDIGCGSGIFSHAAFCLGADRVVSFDIDPLCVECCQHLRGKVGASGNWEIYQGSILDKGFVSGLGKFDIVYCFGTLHHTGRMWDAVKNSASSVKKGGVMYLGLYNKAEGRNGSEFWLKVKKFYVNSPGFVRSLICGGFITHLLISGLIHKEASIGNIKTIKSRRGMDWMTDVNDWLGGYPYEFAARDEVINFMKDHSSGFVLEEVVASRGLANNKYLFVKHDRGVEDGY